MARTPKLLPLLGVARPAVIRRNAAIALSNIGKGREDAIDALRENHGDTDGELRECFEWAMRMVGGE